MMISLTNLLNDQVWGRNTAAGVYLDGTILFVSGLAIAQCHNVWVAQWPVLITLVGWGGMALGAARMFFPEAMLAIAMAASSKWFWVPLIFMWYTGMRLSTEGYS
jgi:hypothetical protein